VAQRFDPQAVGDALADLVRPKGLRRKVRVPDVLGLPISDARLALTRVGLHSEVLRDDPRPPPVEGRVVFQEPDPGTKVRRRSKVRLVLTFD
jgi:beta-lactam-binding protein with PASTA domain